MKEFLSKHGRKRVLLACTGLFLWLVVIPFRGNYAEPLFCYTRDAFGNKALMKDEGVVYVEDVFVVEIPKEEWDGSGENTVTVILEDENGRIKTKTLKLYEKCNK